MAEVYLAKATGAHGFERVVALKRILPIIAEDPDFQTMFIDEARISASLSHANIGQVYEFGQIGNTPFLSMEYISGRDVRRIRTRLAERQSHMPVAMALYITGQLCQALDYAHRMRTLEGESMQIVHRDVSPPNVVVAFQGAVKLIDFGIARARSRITRTRTGKLKGKFAYMSPEQVEGIGFDHRSDIFSCGALLFEMLTHQRPFRGDNEIAVMNAIRTADCPPPSTINPDVPLAVDQIVQKALARDRDQRYQWAGETGAEIQDYFQRTQKSYDAQTLASWMAEAFAPEIEAERAQLRQLRELRPEDCREYLDEEEEAEEGDTVAEPARVGASSAPSVPAAPDTAISAAPGFGATASSEKATVRHTIDPAQVAPVGGAWDTSDLDDEDDGTADSDLPDAPTQIGRPSSLPPLEGDAVEAEEAPTVPAGAPHHSGPIYPDGSSAVVGGALNIDSAHTRPDISDARLGRGGPVEVDGPVETYETRPHQSPTPIANEQTHRSAMPPAPPADFVGKVRFHVLRIVAEGKRRFDLLDSTRRMIVAAGATLLVVGLFVAMIATCGGSDKPKTIPPSGMGSVLVTTSEAVACTVKVDGQLQGLLRAGSTLTIANVMPGSHIISLKCHGYRSYSSTVRVKPGEVALLDAPLKKE